MPVIFSRKSQFPRCRHCGILMDYWVPGLLDSRHAHPECEAKALAQSAYVKLQMALAQGCPLPDGPLVREIKTCAEPGADDFLSQSPAGTQ